MIQKLGKQYYLNCDSCGKAGKFKTLLETKKFIEENNWKKKMGRDLRTWHYYCHKCSIFYKL